MLGRRHTMARLSSDFYRDQYRKVLRWIMGALAIIFILIAAILYFILFHPAQHYYANTSDGKILPMPRQL